ncbi:aspartate ammonia-lyase [Streptomyces caniscabiei]|uniref:Aspartate ammonia-lyase n=1 Tax=Streptomyces caniscabiei TaxID=2746961 RepID=A0A927QJX7_9ACTN|nr:aspartate ammonia-lyase [Streptomyces caniscabiei]MBD9730018.1 aspartate ammonia-lyase [Streptomyces caniscabiei]MDX3515718.1 aspartate ammonia-lyase [Streptomyces caniscabiei]MDX3724971.1 aspartate ammonia-lyase [Streptomyces caniscabiei]MDX3733600.1 aspartate ammonia-lyase [Streptomyces caniscabiei]WEO29742.1 aspartate ammonia-lyase [Streptomyces caniscabiei]
MTSLALLLLTRPSPGPRRTAHRGHGPPRANEVIANVALEHLGHPCGTYTVIHPNEHVNLGQSTNDVYPTALKLAAITATHRLIDALKHLQDAFARKAHAFSDVVKVGRTQLQNAVPMTLGQEFGTYRVMVAEDIARLREALVHLHEIDLGATAIGTGLNAHPEYATAVREHVTALTGLPLVTAPDLVEATQDCGAFVLLSGTVKRTAVKLVKICNDLRLLSSSPRTGLGEITLPARQAGSSIMPGKANPVIPELVDQVAFSVIGNDTTVTMAAEAGQLQLNAFEPVIASCLFRGIGHLTEAVTTLADHCVDGITANAPHLARLVDHSIATVTVLNPHIGYQAATDVATEALATGRPVTQIVRERGLLDDHTVDELLHPARLAHRTLP